MKFRNGDLMETHHLKPKRQGGADKEDNLVLLHKHCHDQYHALDLKRRHEARRNNDNLAPVYREMSDLQAEVMGIVWDRVNDEVVLMKTVWGKPCAMKVARTVLKASLYWRH